jgi:SAM-dependent methyltransferase
MELSPVTMLARLMEGRPKDISKPDYQARERASHRVNRVPVPRLHEAKTAEPDVRQQRVRRFFSDPSRYVKNNFYAELRANIVRSMLPRYSRKSVLDLGAGDGRVSIPLVDKTDDLLLVDSSQRMLELALRNASSVAAGVRTQCIDVDVFEPPALFDVVLCIGLLAHVDDWAKTLRLIGRCVKPGGCAIIQMSDADCLPTRLVRWGTQLRGKFQELSVSAVNRMTFGGVRSELERSGLHLAAVRRYMWVPWLRLAPPPVARSIVALTSAPSVGKYGGEAVAMFIRG